MTISVWPVNAVTGAPVYSGRVLRQAQSALLGGATSARPLGARSGVRPGTPANTVTATSTTWTCKPHAGVLDTQASAIAGPYLYAVDADVTGAVTAANATYPRKDIMYAQLSDPAESDGSSVPGVVIGYVAGTSNVGGTLVVPTMPARSSRIATINVPISGGGSPTVTFDPDYAVAAGGVIPVSSLPSAVLGTADVGVWIDHGGVLYRGDGTTWTRKAGGSLPYLRLRATAPLAHAGASWQQVANLSSGATAGASVGWHNGFGMVTVAADGLYSLDATLSMTIASFSVRIMNRVTFEVLAQSDYGTSTSQTNSAHATVRLSAGAEIVVQVYPSASASVTADAAAASETAAGTPTHLTIVRLSV